MSLQEALAKNAELERSYLTNRKHNALKAQLDQLQKLIFGSKKSALLRKKIHYNYHCLVMVRIRK